MVKLVHHISQHIIQCRRRWEDEELEEWLFDKDELSTLDRDSGNEALAFSWDSGEAEEVGRRRRHFGSVLGFCQLSMLLVCAMFK